MKKYEQLAYKETLNFYNKNNEKFEKPVYQYGWEHGVETMVPVAARIARAMGSEEIATQIEKLLEQEV
jgi:hypothetical protein